jgi:hypothetical protein
LYFVEEDEDGSEMRDVTYGERERERGLACRITIRVQKETEHTHRKV